MVSQRITRDKWARYIASFTPAQGKKIKSMDVAVQGSDFTGTLNVTDVQIQNGNQVTVQMPNTVEILKTLNYNFDEGQTIHATFADAADKIPAIKNGVQPIDYTGMKNRVFNINGRGHETLAFPNVYQEDYKTELLTSGLNLTLYPKNDFDYLRISTNDGALIPGRMYDYKSSDGSVDYTNTHPLNYRYTREFYFNAGKAGDEIQLSCSLMAGYVGNTRYQPGQRAYGPKDSKQRLMMAPYGSFRMRVEFYKIQSVDAGQKDANDNLILTPIYMDTGIGYYGYAQFNQIQQNPNHSF